MATEEAAPLSLANESKEFSTQMENTGSSGRRTVLESHCRTRSLEQRKNKVTRKMLELEQAKNVQTIKQKNFCQTGKKLLNRRVLKKLTSGGQGRVSESSMEASPLLQTKTQSLTAKFEF